jgi:ATP-dependent DNA ligase
MLRVVRSGLGIIEPCLPSPAKAPPSGPGWLHEIKHDGFRIMARRDSVGVRLITRHGNDFTSPLSARRGRCRRAAAGRIRTANATWR